MSYNETISHHTSFFFLYIVIINACVQVRSHISHIKSHINRFATSQSILQSLCHSLPQPACASKDLVTAFCQKEPRESTKAEGSS